MILDLLANDAAHAVLKERLPALLGLVQGEMREFAAFTLHETAKTLPMLDEEAVLAADPYLKSIEI